MLIDKSVYFTNGSSDRRAIQSKNDKFSGEQVVYIFQNFITIKGSFTLIIDKLQ